MYGTCANGIVEVLILRTALGLILFTCPPRPRKSPVALQGYLAHKKTHPPRTLQQPYA